MDEKDNPPSTYGKEEPPAPGYKPPVEGEKPQGACECREFTDHPPGIKIPGADASIRRLIKAFEDELDFYADTPTDATKKFADDLKDADKDYQSIADIVSKYEETYDKLDCMVKEAENRKKEINDWCKEKVEEPVRQKIEALWKDSYEKRENDICCGWIKYRRQAQSLSDCVEAKRETVRRTQRRFRHL